MVKAGVLRVAAAVRRGSEDLSEGIRRIRRGFPEEEPSATAVCIDEGRGKSATALRLAYGSGDMRLFFLRRHSSLAS